MTHLLIGSGLAPLEVEGGLLLVLLEDVVVEQPAHRRRRPGAARAHEEPANVPAGARFNEKRFGFSFGLKDHPIFGLSFLVGFRRVLNKNCPSF